MTSNTVCDAQASVAIYSITEIARTNGLNVYYYIKVLEQVASLIDEQKKIEQSELELYMLKDFARGLLQ